MKLPEKTYDRDKSPYQLVLVLYIWLLEFSMNWNQNKYTENGGSNTTIINAMVRYVHVDWPPHFCPLEGKSTRKPPQIVKKSAQLRVTKELYRLSNGGEFLRFLHELSSLGICMSGIYYNPFYS